MLIVNNLTYKVNHINSIFENISFSVKDTEKISIVGKNGIGKSILLQLIIGGLTPYNGEVIKNNVGISYFPQKFNQINFNTIADVFGLEEQVKSMYKVEKNIAEPEDYEILENHWDCVEDIKNKMKLFDLNFNLLNDFKCLSGGEKVKLILSSIINKNSNLLVLDEPTNNMDEESRVFFYDFIRNWNKSAIIVSHDRNLLNLMDKTFELRRIGMSDTKLFTYGGNFDYWQKQKRIEENALQSDFDNKSKEIKHEKKELQKKIEKNDKKIKQGLKNLKNAKYSSIGFGLMKMQSENKMGKNQTKLKSSIKKTKEDIGSIKEKIEVKKKIYFKFLKNDFSNKLLVSIKNLNFSYDNCKVFDDFSLEVFGRDKIAINGQNGSGKSTLLKIIMKKIINFNGQVNVNTNNIAYLDQYCDFLKIEKSILENIMLYNPGFSEKLSRDILAEFLFRKDQAHKIVKNLSGGEKLRVALACIFSNNPDLLILDEPSNNMDLDSLEILESILLDYKGAIIVVSHDEKFKKNLGVSKNINLVKSSF